jgi:hypothetical protein
MFSSASQLRRLKRNKFRAPGRAAAEDEFGNKICRPPCRAEVRRKRTRGFTQRYAETEKIFGVHNKLQFVIIRNVGVKKANSFAIHKFDYHNQRLTSANVSKSSHFREVGQLQSQFGV